jgi:hypothetical protein
MNRNNQLSLIGIAKLLTIYFLNRNIDKLSHAETKVSRICARNTNVTIPFREFISEINGLAGIKGKMTELTSKTFLAKSDQGCYEIDR